MLQSHNLDEWSSGGCPDPLQTVTPWSVCTLLWTRAQPCSLLHMQSHTWSCYFLQPAWEEHLHIFSNSLVNHNNFVEVQNQLGLKPSELVQLSTTRWADQVRSARAVLNNLPDAEAHSSVFRCGRGAYVRHSSLWPDHRDLSLWRCSQKPCYPFNWIQKNWIKNSSREG